MMGTTIDRGVAEIPLLTATGGGDESLEWAERTRRLVRAVLKTHPALPAAVRIGDPISRRWLTRQANPYLAEINAIAAALDRPGAYFLNVVYEWACSTSAAPDPDGRGARMIRVLDWGLAGLGAHLVVRRQTSVAGDYDNITWPGFVGVITALAPGRFAAAINQAPRPPLSPLPWVDAVATRLAMVRNAAGLPASHLLRRVFDEAASFEAAVTMRSDPAFDLAVPAFFTLSGIAPDECCVIEAAGRQRRIQRSPSPAGAVGVANDWLASGFGGAPHRPPPEWRRGLSHRDYNTIRHDMICAVQRGAFRGAADLSPPVLNSHTVMVATLNARTGRLIVEALAPRGGGRIPKVIARRALAA